MERKKPPHRKQIEAPGRKPPARIDTPRTVRIDPEIWELTMAHAVKLSAKRGYIVTLKEALGDLVRAAVNGEKNGNGKKDHATPDHR